ncbi:MAG TPA: alpha/beta hydrolase [Paraburkholderia sp.]|jgi:arylformamidase|nr:alpha/beta hydrolase [Paraburkholderia sp.]
MEGILFDGDLDREYSPSSVAPNFGAIVASYASGSKDTLQRVPFARLSYGERDEEYVLLFAPQSQRESQPRSLLVFFHGGYWQELSAYDACFPADALVARDIAYAAVNYTLAPHAPVEVIVAQCCNAVNMLAQRFPATRIVLAGSSAGAHLAAMLMSVYWRTFGMAKAPFSGAVLISGIYDLRPLVTTYVNKALALDVGRAQQLSPMFRPAVSTCDTIVCWGEHETSAFKRQSRGYADYLGQAGARVSAYEVPEKNHFDILFDLTNPESRLGSDTLKLLGGNHEYA